MGAYIELALFDVYAWRVHQKTRSTVTIFFCLLAVRWKIQYIMLCPRYPRLAVQF